MDNVDGLDHHSVDVHAIVTDPAMRDRDAFVPWAKDHYLKTFCSRDRVVETVIFLISVVGALCISYGIMKGFILWLISSLMSIIYFIKQKQYPLSMQQIVFTVTNILGIVHHSEEIFHF